MSSRWLIEAFMFQPSLFMSSQILQLCISFPAGWASQRVSNGVTTPKNPTKRSPIDPILHWEEHQESHRITFHSQHPQRTLTKHSNPFVYTGCSAYDGSCLLLVSPCCGTDSLKRNGCALEKCNSCRRWVFFCKWFLHNPPAITLQNKVSQCKIWAIVYLLTYLIDKIPSCALGIQKIFRKSLKISSWSPSNRIGLYGSKHLQQNASWLTRSWPAGGIWGEDGSWRRWWYTTIHLSLDIQSSLYLEGNSAG